LNWELRLKAKIDAMIIVKSSETFEKCSILFKFKEGENFNHPGTICQTYGASRNTLSILRIALKVSATLHSVSLRAKC
jgi:nicotinate-nucleotide pyrophosphorylase